MSLQQWNDHSGHLKGHIMWPASKKDIIEACKGEDVEPEVLNDLRKNLPEGKYDSPEEVKKILVN